MKDITEKIIELNFDELISNLNLEFDKKIGLIVHKDDVKYEFVLNLKGSNDDLLILGSGALGFRIFDRTRPYIDRNSWHFKQSTIHYHDPTYYVDDSITAGWCIGTEEDYYLENIAKILQIIIDKLGIPNSNVLFYGSSAGGFTSLMLSVLIKDSISLADVPQLYIYNFKSREKLLDTWLDVKKQCFSEMSNVEFINAYKYRLSFIEMVKREQYVPNAYLVLDCSVNLDFYTQYTPFFMDLFQDSWVNESNKFKLIINWKNKGHAPVSKEETINLINTVFDINKKDMITEELNSNLSSINIKKRNTVVEKLNKYNTARVDVKLEGGRDNDLYILNIDDTALVSRPSWLNNETGPGLVMVNDTNSMSIKIRCKGDGEVIVRLRAVDFKYAGKRLPIYIIYTKVLINGEIIINKNRLTWHNDPIIFKKSVQDNEIINIEVEYMPC